MGRANPIDAHVGARLRQRRALLGLSQDKLARSLGLTFQQIQKYERGTNRISAGRLYQLATALAVPVGYFYSGLERADADPAAGPVAPLQPANVHVMGDAGAAGPRGIDNGAMPGAGNGLCETPAGDVGDVLSSRETLDLVRAYYRISSHKLRRRVLELVRAIDSGAAQVPKAKPSVIARNNRFAALRTKRRQG